MSKWEHTRHCLHAQPRKAHSVPRSPRDKRPDRLTVDTGRYEQTSIHTMLWNRSNSTHGHQQTQHVATAATSQLSNQNTNPG